MNKIIDYFVSRSLVVNLISFVILVAGLMSMFSLQKETFPTVDFETITIRANYPGASAEDVEKLVSIPLERELKNVEGVEELNVMSGEGYSLAILKVDQEYKTDAVLDEARIAVDSVTNLPSDVEKPVLRKAVNTLRPIMKIAVKGDDEWKIREKAKELRDEIERLPGIAKVNFEGFRDEKIEVKVDPKKLSYYELTVGELSTAIRDRNINLAGGTIKKKDQEIIVRTMNEFKDDNDIKNVVVRSNSSGANVKIEDLAEVSTSLDEEAPYIRSRGKKAVLVRVIAKSTADIISTSEIVKNKTKEFFDKLPTEFSFEVQDELAFYVKRRLGVLTSNGVQGSILVFICLLAFLNLRVSLITSFGIPLSLLITFILMEFLGISLNLISMFGLILVLGMLVDDSIIVAEDFYQKIEAGMEPKEAASKAAKDTLIPVSATITTTMAAFSALFFMSGTMGKFLWPVPAVVIICLLGSWFECFFILPSHLADFVKYKKEGVERTRWYKPLMDSYYKQIKFLLSKKKTTISVFLGLFIIAVIVSINMRRELFPGDDVQVLYVKIKGQVGTPKEDTNAAIEKIENVIFENLKKEELDALTAEVGYQRSENGNVKVGSHYAQATIFLTMQNDRNRLTDDIISELSAKIKMVLKDFEFSVDKVAGGPPKGKPVNVQLYGDDLELLKEYSKKIQEIIKKQKGVLTTEIDYEDGKPQLVVKIKEEEARRLGLSNTQVAMELRRAFAGEIATEIKKSDEDIDVVVRLNESARATTKTLEDLYILNNQQRRIKLLQIADVTSEPGSFVIRRMNRKRAFQISAEIDKVNNANSIEINKNIKPLIDELIKDKKLAYELTGENKDTQESMSNFARAGLLSLCTIFVILVMMFSSFVQPLIVMSAIPMGLIGVVFTFKLYGLPVSFMAMMGIIGLVGVVVNDSIVLVNTINIKLAENVNLDRLEVIAQSCVSRLRPVLLTTVTTVAGLIPIAHSSGGDPFLKPMAMSFAYGLAFATSLTLAFVPCLYLSYLSISDWFNLKFKQLKA